MIHNGMQSDAVPYSPTSQRLILRQHFYTFMRQVSNNSDLTGFARYMRDGLSEIGDLSFCENFDSFSYLKKLYALQLIHPQNVEFIRSFAEYKGNVNLLARIDAYYQLVNGKEELLIPAKFNTCSDHVFVFHKPIIEPQITPVNFQNNSNYSSFNQTTTTSPISEPTIATVESNEMPNIPGPFLYPITKGSPHGFCVIINNEHFHSISSLVLRERAGTKRDGEQLEQTFHFLNYYTQTYNDVTTPKMWEILQELSKRDHTQFDSFVCCLLSHGNAGRIYGSDSTDIVLNEIYNLFDAKNCPTLGGKPKIFIVQACRGTEIDKGAKKLDEYCFSSQQMEIDMPPPIPFQFDETPHLCDFLIAYGTVEGYVAWRHPDNGSWFIDILCNKLCDFFDKRDIVQILTFVNSDISKKNTPEGSKQMAEPVIMMKGIFFFKPPDNVQVNYL